MIPEEKTIYELGLHETTLAIIIGVTWSITRVASGWIYQNDIISLGIFVPFDNKFQATE